MSFWSILKGTIFAVLIFSALIVGLIVVFTPTLGIFVEISFLSFGALVLVFVVLNYVYSKKSVSVKGRSITRNIAVLFVCLVFLGSSVLVGMIVFMPHSHVAVGITYCPYVETPAEIPLSINRFREDGFASIRLTWIGGIEYPTSLKDGNYAFQQTKAFYDSINMNDLDVLLITPSSGSPEFDQYIYWFGQKIKYYQFANEIDLLYWHTGVDGGNNFPYTREEMDTIIQNLKLEVQQNGARQDAQFITTFSAVFPSRVDWLLLGVGVTNGFEQIASHVDAVGYDVYLEQGAVARPFEVSYLRGLTLKPVWITEVGVCTSDDKKQADYIVDTLNYAAKNVVSRVYVQSWVLGDDNNAKFYAIKDRLAEQAIREWIKQNA
jgi:hypothetical protein